MSDRPPLDVHEVPPLQHQRPCPCESCHISRDANTHPWRLVRHLWGDWGHHIYWATHCASCAQQVPYTGDSDLRMCPRCETRDQVSE